MTDITDVIGRRFRPRIIYYPETVQPHDKRQFYILSAFRFLETIHCYAGAQMYISLLAADKRNHGPHQDNEEGAMQQQYGKPPP